MVTAVYLRLFFGGRGAFIKCRYNRSLTLTLIVKKSINTVK